MIMTKLTCTFCQQKLNSNVGKRNAVRKADKLLTLKNEHSHWSIKCVLQLLFAIENKSYL